MLHKFAIIGFIFVVFAAPAGAVTNSSADAGAHQGQLLDRVVAVVNDKVILLSELDQQMTLTRERMASRGTPVPSADALRHQVLDQMIATRLQLQRAKRRGIHVSDEILNRALTHIARQNGFSLNEMPARLAAQGIDYKQFREHIRHEIVLRQLQQKAIDEHVVVTPAEVDQYMIAQAKQGHGNTQYHVYQILLRVPADASQAKASKIHQKAKKLYKTLEKNGSQFKAKAAAISNGRRALKGGDLGWLAGGQLPTSLANTILTMDTGEIAPPVKDADGWHILKLAGKRARHKVIVTQTHARHILIKSNLLVSNSEAEQRLEHLRDKIEHGASFSKLAKKYSDDPGSASQGGDLGWLDPGTVVPAFQHKMDQLQPKQISQPFETQFGWHIVQVLGRRKQNQTKKSQHQRAYKAVLQRKKREKKDRWLRKLRAGAYVKTKLDDGGTTW
jgi:peptidyl-prolyl cis-trans isomerase SurA